ncbi:MAG: phosphatase PAP2 family protein [Methylococcales bacterium]|nr:phosphatase PAP2 family protein [Methylococcales bacterium]
MRRIWVVYGAICLGAWLINALIYRYPGNPYLEIAPAFVIGLVQLALIAHGFYIYWGAEAQTVRLIREVLKWLLFFTFYFGGITFLQFTPFPVIDHYLVWIDSLLHVDVGNIVTQMHAYPGLWHFFNKIYYSLDIEIVLAPLLVIIFRRYIFLREYYAYLLISTAIGVGIYYFFPTVAPASMFSSPYFTPEQHATGIKFNEIHHYIVPSTAEGGMISFPSFHVIWAWFSMYLLRWFRWLFIVLFCFNTLLVLSCVLLGWHYLIDIFGSVAVIALTHWIYAQYVAKPTSHQLAMEI